MLLLLAIPQVPIHGILGNFSTTKEKIPNFSLSSQTIDQCGIISLPLYNSRETVYFQQTYIVSSPISKPKTMQYKTRFFRTRIRWMSSNMINLGKKKKRKRIHWSYSSNSKHSSYLKGVFEEPQGIFRNTRLQKRVTIPLDYRKMAGIFSDEEEEETNSVVVES